MHTFTRMTVRAALAAAALLPLGAALSTATASAGAGTPPTLTGVVSCDATTGFQVVTWTFTNSSGSPVTIDSTSVEGPATGTALDSSATMSSTSLANGDVATGVTHVSGDATGDYHLIVNYTISVTDPVADGEVVLPGGCVQVIDTTTTTATTVAPTTTVAATSTTVAAVAVAVAAQPTFTG